jgi:hypothetical protein
MGRLVIAQLPGRANINDQFIPKNLRKTLRYLKKLLKDGNGTYQFGTLTAMYNGYAPGSPEYINWMEEVALYDKPARDKIKNAVIAAVTYEPDPLPITFKWNPTGSPQNVTVTQTSSSCTIEITGYPAPASSALADRKKKKT